MPSNKHVRDSAKTQAHDTNSHVSRQNLKSAALAGGGACLSGRSRVYSRQDNDAPKTQRWSITSFSSPWRIGHSIIFLDGCPVPTEYKRASVIPTHWGDSYFHSCTSDSKVRTCRSRSLLYRWQD